MKAIILYPIIILAITAVVWVWSRDWWTRIQMLAVVAVVGVLVMRYRDNDDAFHENCMGLVDFLPFSDKIRQTVTILRRAQASPTTKNPTGIKHSKRNVTALQKKIVASNQEWKCRDCRELLDFSYEVDHIQPLFQGGNNDMGNLQALCRNCHGRKTLQF